MNSSSPHHLSSLPLPLCILLMGEKRKREEEDSAPSAKRVKRCSLHTIISGGQTGADRAGLEAARALSLDTGGWAPNGFLTSAGNDISLQRDFHLQETEWNRNKAVMYITRSKLNVDNSDGTVLFRTRDSPGTDKTWGYCLTHRWQKPLDTPPIIPYRPVLVLRELDEDAAKKLGRFIIRHKIGKLNVAGHRDTDPKRTWQNKVQTFLTDALGVILHK